MGTGASAGSAGAGALVSGANAGTHQGGSSGSQAPPLMLTAADASAIVEGGGVQWLANVILREKQEKEWLSNKFDEKCNEVHELHKELALLREELAAARRVDGTPCSPCTSASQASAASAGGGAGLMGRRGLTLSVSCGETGSRPGRGSLGLMSPVQEHHVSKPLHPAIAVAAAPAAESVKVAVIGGAVGPSSEDPWAAEPTSALLKRRTKRVAEMQSVASMAEEKDVTSSTSVAEAAGEDPEKTHPAKESPPRQLMLPMGAARSCNSTAGHSRARFMSDFQPVASDAVIQVASFDNMHVGATKVGFLEDCPASPKREVRRGRTESSF